MRSINNTKKVLYSIGEWLGYIGMLGLVIGGGVCVGTDEPPATANVVLIIGVALLFIAGMIFATPPLIAGLTDLKQRLRRPTA